ncbi:hypothetical protein DSO57_1005846 [Entomophthora muscae]|uniref:Uncharacterized protein n=1 Tax=Entomophthora muscae TaxID=34485 RepID=A0ACC2UT23_9FUNG|nr:hypothetical protein DSO57_1005846 [Entomophthora muscae]
MACWRDDNKALSHKIASLETKLLKASSKDGNSNKSQGQDNGGMDWLDLDLSQYRLSRHQVSGWSPFAMLYGQEATTPSILGPPLIEVDASVNPETHVKDLTNQIIDIQATAYSNAYKVKALELLPSNAARAPLPEYQVGDLVLYYQNCTGGQAHKLYSLWVGP